MKKVNSVDEYLAGLPPDQRAAINKLRKQIKQAAPEVIEVIGWGVPQFKVNGKYIAGVAAYKNHVSFAPWGGWNGLVDEVELGELAHTEKLIHFTLEKSIPDSLVKKLIQGRIRENERLASEKKTRNT